ncbi:MAG: YbaY family lipoprotein [Armatimonadota bacterium]
MHMPHNRIQMAGMVAVLLVLQAILPGPAAAEIGDISVGGVWICRLTTGASGMTLEQRVTQINQRITDVLSLPELGRRQILVEVRPVGAAAAIVVAEITIMTVISEDTTGTGVAAHEVANQWAARLAQGLRRALPGREVITRMHVQPPVPRPKEVRWLAGITWYWQGTLMHDGSQFIPDDRRRYTVFFSRHARVAVRADCNRGVGRYVLRGRVLTISGLALTKVACPPGSLERRFLAQLNDVGSLFRRRELLHLKIKYDSGAMTFGKVLSEAYVTGTVTYRQRIALPPDAVLNVQLRDASKADAQANVFGRRTIITGGRQVPLAFEIRYDSSRISANATVIVSATISMGGRLLFTTATVQRVITRGYPSKGIEVILEPVR